MENSSFVVVDIETTGLSRYRDKITEFSGVKVVWNAPLKIFDTEDELSMLINPERRIPEFITKLTGITNGMVKDAPVFDGVAFRIKEFIGGNVVVAHNATFDYNFLDHNLRINGIDGLSNDALCTCKLSRRLVPDLSSYRLGSVCRHFGIDNSQAHRAMGDALATKDVLNHLYRYMKTRRIELLEDALKFQKSRIARVTRAQVFYR
jgi:DNA polymerase III epsilon subunit family exonuclease